MKLVVLLSTFNGEKYLASQLESVLNQTLSCSKIIIRDDGSSDNTQRIIKQYAEKYRHIHFLQDTQGHVGIQASYALLLNQAALASPDYVLYCDQDDIWFPEKTNLLLQKMVSLQSPHLPTLVFSDVTVVDEHLNVLSHSYTHLQKLNAACAVTFKKLLFLCPALGCAMIFNAPLLKLAIKAFGPACLSSTIQHDQWLLLLATTQGQVGYLSQPTSFYRQHADNTRGALLGIQRKCLHFKNFKLIQMRYQTAIDQASEIKKHLSPMSNQAKEMLDKFIQLFTGSLFTRLKNYGYFFTVVPHWKRKMALFISLFFKYKINP